jgi:hypothetical protein
LYEPVKKKFQVYQEKLTTIHAIVTKTYEYGLEDRHMREIKKLKNTLVEHESRLSTLEMIFRAFFTHQSHVHEKAPSSIN